MVVEELELALPEVMTDQLGLVPALNSVEANSVYVPGVPE